MEGVIREEEGAKWLVCGGMPRAESAEEGGQSWGGVEGRGEGGGIEKRERWVRGGTGQLCYDSTGGRRAGGEGAENWIFICGKKRKRRKEGDEAVDYERGGGCKMPICRDGVEEGTTYRSDATRGKGGGKEEECKSLSGQGTSCRIAEDGHVPLAGGENYACPPTPSEQTIPF